MMLRWLFGNRAPPETQVEDDEEQGVEPPHVSRRVVDQRLRNRIMEILDMLVDWETTIPSFGATGYFNWFFDFFPDHPPPYPNPALTDPEREAIGAVHLMMDQACDATSDDVSEAQLVASGWPQRIKPVAQDALALMMQRGRFSEDTEEGKPSSMEPWPNGS